jgi:hypothetical protein
MTSHGRRRIAALTVAGVTLSASVGCGPGAERKRDADSAGAVAPAPVAAADGDCPLTGKWELCSVRDRLEHAGLVPQPRDSVRPAFASVPGVVYGIGRGELQIFLYPDSAARAQNFARFDAAQVQSVQSSGGTPTLIVSNNLAAILLSDNATQVERVRLALQAGLPER